ncbi:MAG: O-sialoglycoprotein endopeptidase [Bacillota bacterium]|nr:O-sialoglycoprotein endopeptidase [Bacillota bacterium]MDD4707660.1 O-sialoglycoprotein endopeptidase [Bacillota bacterium]
MDVYIGFDTSCYTTSVAVVDSAGRLVLDHRRVLEVKQGERGLRQSEGVFQHIRNLGDLSRSQVGFLDGMKVAAAAASVKPRPVEGSYMPVFTVGENAARVAAAVANIPFFETTHQENHLMAGLWSAGGPWSERFLTVHLSGGTTELLDTVKEGADFDTRIVGGTTDISAGQFVDRVGVAMGLPFPCGPHLEKLAEGTGDGVLPIEIKCYTKRATVSFSGPETGAKRLLESGKDRAGIALGVFLSIARGLGRIIDAACEKKGLQDVLMVGGVSSNKYIREYLEKSLKYNLYFPKARYCSDNAVGAALIALEKQKNAM